MKWEAHSGGPANPRGRTESLSGEDARDCVAMEWNSRLLVPEDKGGLLSFNMQSALQPKWKSSSTPIFAWLLRK